MAFNQTTTVQKIIDFCSIHTALQTYFGIGGVQAEPGLTICNNVLQSLFVDATPWKFNRKELCGPERGDGNFLVTQYGVQDYRWAGATAFVLNNGVGVASNPPGGAQIDLAASPVNGGTAGITVSGGIVTVQTIDPHPFLAGSTVYMIGNTVAAYNSILTFSATQHTSAWTNGWTILTVADNKHFTFAATSGQVSSSGAPGFGTLDQNFNLTGLFAWGWLESASWQDVNSTQFPQPINPIRAVRELSPNAIPTGDMLAICMLADYNNGVLKFRLSEPMGTQSIQINLVYQALAPKLTSPQAVFPWPDDRNFVLFETCLAQAFRYAKGISSKETQLQMQMANGAVQSVFGSEGGREDVGHVVAPTRSLMR